MASRQEKKCHRKLHTQNTKRDGSQIAFRSKWYKMEILHRGAQCGFGHVNHTMPVVKLGSDACTILYKNQAHKETK